MGRRDAKECGFRRRGASHPQLGHTVKGKPRSLFFFLIFLALSVVLLNFVVSQGRLLSTHNSRKTHWSNVHRHSNNFRRHSRRPASCECGHSGSNSACRCSYGSHTCSYSLIDALRDCTSRCSNSGISTRDNDIRSYCHGTDSYDRGLSTCDCGDG